MTTYRRTDAAQADRARVLAALHAASLGINAATLADERWEDAGEWAVAMLTEIRQVRRDLEFAQDRLAWIATEVGVTQRRMAEAAGVAAMTPARWARRGTNPVPPPGAVAHHGDKGELRAWWDAAGIPTEVQEAITAELGSR